MVHSICPTRTRLLRTPRGCGSRMTLYCTKATRGCPRHGSRRFGRRCLPIVHSSPTTRHWRTSWDLVRRMTRVLCGTRGCWTSCSNTRFRPTARRSEEHTSELQSHHDLVCRLLLEKKKKNKKQYYTYKKKKTKTNKE